MKSLLERAVARGVTPGGILVVGDAGADLSITPFGRITAAADAPAVGPETVYDIASLTKPIATTAVLMRLVGQAVVSLDTPVRSLLPELSGPGTGDIRIRHLAGHAAGFPAHVELFRRLWAGERAGAETAREALLRMAAATPLQHSPGERVVYSDIGYILLGFALERAAGERLDRLVARLVTGPLSMTTTGYVDLDAEPPAPRPQPVAPTERCSRRGLVAGEVHDENAHAAGGVVGHAGLFATGGDVAAFARAIATVAGAGRAVAGFEPEVVSHFLSTSAAPDTTWRLGWDRPSPRPGVSHAGDAWPRDGVGHLGFTGCSMWLDPPRGRYAVLLTNRVHPSRHREGIRALRREVMDEVVRSLGD